MPAAASPPRFDGIQQTLELSCNPAQSQVRQLCGLHERMTLSVLFGSRRQGGPERPPLVYGKAGALARPTKAMNRVAASCRRAPKHHLHRHIREGPIRTPTGKDETLGAVGLTKQRELIQDFHGARCEWHPVLTARSHALAWDCRYQGVQVDFAPARAENLPGPRRGDKLRGGATVVSHWRSVWIQAGMHAVAEIPDMP